MTYYNKWIWYIRSVWVCSDLVAWFTYNKLWCSCPVRAVHYSSWDPWRTPNEQTEGVFTLSVNLRWSDSEFVKLFLVSFLFTKKKSKRTKRTKGYRYECNLTVFSWLLFLALLNHFSLILISWSRYGHSSCTPKQPHWDAGLVHFHWSMNTTWTTDWRMNNCFLLTKTNSNAVLNCVLSLCDHWMSSASVQTNGL